MEFDVNTRGSAVDTARDVASGGNNGAGVAVKFDEVMLSLPNQSGLVEILRGVTVEIKRGETIGLVGPSGSGKTSLMLLMTGLERATSGRLDVLGRDLQALGEEELAVLRRDHIGIVFQGFHLVPSMTALENVMIPLELARRPDAAERARESLAEVGLEHRTDHYPSQLSGGEQQRVAVARAFTHDPELIFADEPTGNLDRTTGEKIIELMLETAARKNVTMITITHDPNLAARCGRELQMSDGRIL